MPNYEFVDQFYFFFALIAEKQDKKDAWTQKKDILRPVQQDAELKDRGPKKKLSGSTEKSLSHTQCDSH